jgi:hypothetical protein
MFDLTWVLLIVVLWLMSSWLFAISFKLWPLSGFHVCEHSLVGVYSTFLDTFFSYKATIGSYPFVVPSIKIYYVLFNSILWFLALVLLWLDFVVTIDWNIFGKLMVPKENNIGSITN